MSASPVLQHAHQQQQVTQLCMCVKYGLSVCKLQNGVSTARSQRPAELLSGCVRRQRLARIAQCHHIPRAQATRHASRSLDKILDTRQTCTPCSTMF